MLVHARSRATPVRAARAHRELRQAGLGEDAQYQLRVPQAVRAEGSRILEPQAIELIDLFLVAGGDGLALAENLARDCLEREIVIPGARSTGQAHRVDGGAAGQVQDGLARWTASLREGGGLLGPPCVEGDPQGLAPLDDDHEVEIDDIPARDNIRVAAGQAGGEGPEKRGLVGEGLDAGSRGGVAAERDEEDLARPAVLGEGSRDHRARAVRLDVEGQPPKRAREAGRGLDLGLHEDRVHAASLPLFAAQDDGPAYAQRGELILGPAPIQAFLGDPGRPQGPLGLPKASRLQA